MTDLVGGRIPIAIHATNELVEMARAGSIRVLATSDRQRSAFLQDVPTFRELGYDLQGSGWYGLFRAGRHAARNHSAGQRDRGRRARKA